jgi:predicted nucleotidyltransferase component of viral defense system
MTTKIKGESVRAKLKSLASKMKIKYSHLETVFLIERLVARLIADKKLSQNLVFKGGFVGLKVYQSPRYTIDLDALLVKSNIEQTLDLVKQQAQSDMDDGVWFRFESQTDLATQGEYGGIRHTYRTGIGEILKDIKRAQIINFDLGIGDPITPGPQKVEVKTFTGNENLSWSVYPVETICAEKLHALISHGDDNSRSKDVHDLAVFLPKADPQTLKKAIKNCFEFRETEVPDSLIKAIRGLKTGRLEKGWDSAMASITEPMSFEQAFIKMLGVIEEIETKWS